MNVLNCNAVNLSSIEGSLFSKIESFGLFVLDESLEIYEGYKWGIIILSNKEEDDFLFQFSLPNDKNSKLYKTDEFYCISDFVSKKIEKDFGLQIWEAEGLFNGIKFENTEILDEEGVEYAKSKDGFFKIKKNVGMKGILGIYNNQLNISVKDARFLFDGNKVEELNDIIGYISTHNYESIIIT